MKLNFEFAERMEKQMLLSLNVIEHGSPVEFRAKFYANMVLTMSLAISKWTPEQLEAAQKPCGTEGCSCHLVIASALAAIRSVRTEGARKFEGDAALVFIGKAPPRANKN